MHNRLWVTLIIIAVTALSATAETPLGTAFTYQGQLKNAGSPANGLHDLRFQLYDASELGAPVGPGVCLDNVSVIDGNFTVLLDFGAEFNGNERFLEIEVRADSGLDCTNPNDYVILSPRQSLTATPNALFASNADLIDGLNSTAFLQSIPAPLTLSDTSATHIIRGENASTAAASAGMTGVSSASTGTTYGMCGLNSSDGGTGVFGMAAAVNGNNYGGWFASVSTSGTGASGWASALQGVTCGVSGRSDSPVGRGVYGLATATHLADGLFGSAGVGVWGESLSEYGRGIYGKALHSNGITYGVLGESISSFGRGVQGYAGLNHGSTYGVIGEVASASGWAVFADGRLGASGTKSFRIDHPDDPASKYLLHYSTESPEVLNAYSGTVVLDERGEAVVQLPHYFAKINRDPRYTLTAVGAPMPMLHVATEIDEAALCAGARAGPGEPAPVCSFRIAGGAPGAKVSWRVEAVRNDRWVRQHGAPVEVEKQDLERGTYQHPELYGQPPENGMNYDAQRDRPEPGYRRPGP